MATLKRYNSTTSSWEYVSGSNIGIANAPICFHAHKNSVNQTGFASGKITSVTFPTITFNVGGGYNTSINRFQPSIAGYYYVKAQVYCVSIGGGLFVETILYKNSTILGRNAIYSAASGAWQNAATSTIVYLNGTTDYITVSAYQNTGSTQYILGGSEYTYFTGYLITAPNNLIGVVDLTSASTDHYLGVGETAKVTYTSATTVPLNIQVIPGARYTIEFTGNIQDTNYSNSTNICFYPNNNYSLAVGDIDYSRIGNTEGVFTGTASSTATTFSTGDAYKSFIFGSSANFIGTADVYTATTCKILRCRFTSRTGSNSFADYISTQIWNDIVTEWTSLGTIVFPYTRTGTIFIKRVY